MGLLKLNIRHRNMIEKRVLHTKTFISIFYYLPVSLIYYLFVIHILLLTSVVIA